MKVVAWFRVISIGPDGYCQVCLTALELLLDLP